jgi:hypothetical protein
MDIRYETKNGALVLVQDLSEQMFGLFVCQNRCLVGLFVRTCLVCLFVRTYVWFVCLFVRTDVCLFVCQSKCLVGLVLQVTVMAVCGCQEGVGGCTYSCMLQPLYPQVKMPHTH